MRGGDREAGPREPILALGVTNQRETVVSWDARLGHARSRPRSSGRTRARRRIAAALIEDGIEPEVRVAHRASHPHVFLGHEDPLAPRRTCPRRGSSPGPGDLRIGTMDSWVIWNLTGRAARRSPRDRPDERVAHASVLPRQPGLGRGAARRFRRVRAGAAADRALHRGASRTAGRAPAGRFARARPGLRGSRRPAGGSLRAGLLSRPERRRTPTAPDPSCSQHTGETPASSRHGLLSTAAAASPGQSAPMRSKAPSP